MKVEFSRLSILKLEILLAFLENKWSENSKQKFLKLLDSKISLIQSNPLIFPASSLDINLRKCVVTKQTTIFYEVNNNTIFVLNIVDTRQNPDEIYEELKALLD